MCNILLPIKPKYVQEIINGNKYFEYRKSIPKRKVDKIVIYSSSPIMKVIGEIRVSKVHESSPEQIWNLSQNKHGISRKEYDEYFSNREKAYAYEFTYNDIIIYDKEKTLADLGIKSAPQSFMYLD